jgi:ADP-ribose pyrophosphatase YjhB (NUDIX family)
MKKSAGLVIIQNNKILLGHPTGSPWYGTYSIPKGEMEEHESALETAIRETAEELGVEISFSEVNQSSEGVIDYTDTNGEIYKKVFYYVTHPVVPIVIDKSKLQTAEIDWAGFLTKEEAGKRIFGRFKPLLKYLK